MRDEQESGFGIIKRCGIDAELWAQELVKRGVAVGDPSPGEQLHGWLCNIIMTAFDHGYYKGERHERASIMRSLARRSYPSNLVCETDAIILNMGNRLDDHWQLNKRQREADAEADAAREAAP